MAVSESAGLTPLGDTTLASQPTMSRLIDTLAIPSNLHQMDSGRLEGAIRCGHDGRGLAKQRVRGDAGFPSGATLDALEARGNALCANVSETTVRFLFDVEGEGRIADDQAEV
ncbi:MAG: hypothetical protein K8J09_00720 [Planctomycetes bacterium]|nr:hypothetical protein [Planctomycetota bacterium]